MELGSVTLKRIGFFCFPIKHSTHTYLGKRFTRTRHESPYPPRSLVRDEQTHPHRPRLVVSHSTCPPLSSSPPANSFVIGPAVINTHTLGTKFTSIDFHDTCQWDALVQKNYNALRNRTGIGYHNHRQHLNTTPLHPNHKRPTGIEWKYIGKVQPGDHLTPIFTLRLNYNS
jgi:hypothetical protein